ncbi:MAG: helix-turn-helix transcriptional regulator [Oscillospiraceae bacterium]|nr:helix-turn-helix transcriptional regulator [Oscillospiraceae bacterium]
METTIGKRIALLRRKKGYTQDELAEKLSVSPQAVSKWENDLSCPDIMLLPPLAELLETTVDELLTERPSKPETSLVPDEERKNLDDMIFKVIVNSSKGDKVRVNLPMPLVRIGLEMGMKLPQISDNENLRDALSGIDLMQILTLVEKGVIGKLVEVESAEGDIVEVLVE